MRSIEYLKSLPRDYIPRKPSNAELYRWLQNGSITINGKHPKPNDEVVFPITELKFFKGENRVTIWQE